MIHGTCHYCQRALKAPGRGKLTATKDHVWPKSRGGRRTVRACFQCNHLKADMSPERWRWVMERFPRWWKVFHTHGDLLRAIEQERAEKIRASAERRYVARYGPRWPVEVRVARRALCRGLV